MHFIDHSADYRPEGRVSEDMRFSPVKTGLILGAVAVFLLTVWSLFF